MLRRNSHRYSAHIQSLRSVSKSLGVLAKSRIWSLSAIQILAFSGFIALAFRLFLSSNLSLGVLSSHTSPSGSAITGEECGYVRARAMGAHDVDGELDEVCAATHWADHEGAMRHQRAEPPP